MKSKMVVSGSRTLAPRGQGKVPIVCLQGQDSRTWALMNQGVTTETLA